MNDKYIKLWKQLVAIVPKFEEELPTGGPMLGSLAIARGLMIIKGFTILDASLLIRKGGTCRHGRICCKVGHFVHGDKGVDFADLYLRKLHEEASFSEEKLDLLTLQFDKFGATLQKIDRVAFEVINSCLENLKMDIANASKKIENFDSLSSIKAVKKTSGFSCWTRRTMMMTMIVMRRASRVSNRNTSILKMVILVWMMRAQHYKGLRLT